MFIKSVRQAITAGMLLSLAACANYHTPINEAIVDFAHARALRGDPTGMFQDAFQYWVGVYGEPDKARGKVEMEKVSAAGGAQASAWISIQHSYGIAPFSKDDVKAQAFLELALAQFDEPYYATYQRDSSVNTYIALAYYGRAYRASVEHRAADAQSYGCAALARRYVNKLDMELLIKSVGTIGVKCLSSPYGFSS